MIDVKRSNGTRILVTGGAGMIGSNLVRRLVALGYETLVVDNLWRGQLCHLDDKTGNSVIDLDRQFFNVDLAASDNFDHLFDGVDYVFHLADIVAGINYVFGNQGSLFRQNLLINSNVIAAARRSKIKGFTYVGTACSFPASMQVSTDSRLLVEEDAYPAEPESAYGWSKLMGEYETELFAEETGTPTTILRLHNVYGAPCDYDSKRGQVIPSLIRKAIRYPEEPFVVWGSGQQGRAFVHVDDVVSAAVAALEKGMGHGVIQIGPDRCTSIREIVETVVELSGKNIDIDYDTTRPEGDRWRAADYSKARDVLGWSPQVSLVEGVASLYRWIEADMARSAIAANASSRRDRHSIRAVSDRRLAV
jgi:nucleoside-diphosphate-sugar epimerase